MFEDGKIKEKPLAYLAGSVMAAVDDGIGWRTNILSHIYDLGYQVFNPPIDQPKLSGITKADLNKQKSEELDIYKSSCSKVVDTDLDVLVKSKIIIAKIDSDVLKGAGTFGELTVARLKGIPVFAWIDLPNGLRDIPAWALGCISHYSVNEKEFYKMIPSATSLNNKHSDLDEFDHWKSDT